MMQKGLDTLKGFTSRIGYYWTISLNEPSAGKERGARSCVLKTFLRGSAFLNF